MIDFGIIAAGDGNRIRHEGSKLPKPLLDMGGTPMIGRLISLMEAGGASSVNIIVNDAMPEVENYLQNYVPDTKCVLKILSTRTPSSMHSFYELIELMKPADKFIVTTVDTIFRGDVFNSYIEYFKNAPDDVDGVMGITSFVDDETPLYVNVDCNNDIISFTDEAPEIKATYKTFISAGIYGLCKTSLPILQKSVTEGVSRMRNFQRQLVESGLKLKAFNFGKVVDIDHLSDIEKANALLV